MKIIIWTDITQKLTFTMVLLIIKLTMHNAPVLATNRVYQAAAILDLRADTLCPTQCFCMIGRGWAKNCIEYIM